MIRQSRCKSWRPWVGAALFLASNGAASAAVVPLSSAVGTFDQGGAFLVSTMIDGTTSGDNGWGVFGGQFDPQSTVFTTVSPLNTTDLVFEVAQTSPYVSHNVNEFRLSVTNDPAPSNASAWTPLTITHGSAAATLVAAGDNHVRALFNTAAQTYTLKSTAPFNGITGFRFEVFPYDFDPNDALAPSIGRGSNGNFVVSEFTVKDAIDAVFQNAALGRPTVQSTDGFGLTGAQGVDGIIGGGNITHTNTGDLFPYWEVDLESSVLIDNILLHNRDNCCPERLYNITVDVRSATDAVLFTSQVFNPVSEGGTPTDPGPTIAVDLPGAGVTGRKVRVSKTAVNGNSSSEWLSLSEVQVFTAGGLTPILTPGDFNSDGSIDLDDFDVLRNNFHAGTEFADGDINFDGEVDLNDFVAFVNAYNDANPGAPNGVPEPSSLALFGIAGVAFYVVRRRRA